MNETFLTDDEITSIFSNVELILKVNKAILNNLLQDFQEAGGNIQMVNVGRAFSSLVSGV
jgi:hypothetical protein